MHCLLVAAPNSLTAILPMARVLLHTLQISFNLFPVTLGKCRYGQCIINSTVGQTARYTVSFRSVASSMGDC